VENAAINLLKIETKVKLNVKLKPDIKKPSQKMLNGRLSGSQPM